METQAVARPLSTAVLLFPMMQSETRATAPQVDNTMENLLSQANIVLVDLLHNRVRAQAKAILIP